MKMNEQKRIKQFNHYVDLLLDGEADDLLLSSDDCRKEVELVHRLLELDPSKQSKICQPLRQTLLTRVKNKVNKVSDQGWELSDDELEGISAAGEIHSDWDK